MRWRLCVQPQSELRPGRYGETLKAERTIALFDGAIELIRIQVRNVIGRLQRGENGGDRRLRDKEGPSASRVLNDQVGHACSGWMF